jgi:transketolase
MSKIDLRKQFFNWILAKAKKDDRIILLLGDLGYSFCEQFQKELPKQIINVGCIEQSMVGIASGLARQGLKPYVYSGSIFLIARAYEQVRNDVCYNNLDVKLIGTGASGFLGFSHNWEGKENEEDLLKNLPKLKRYYPKDEAELEKVLTKSLRGKTPTFIKL